MKQNLSEKVRENVLHHMMELLNTGQRNLPTERRLAALTGASYSTVRLVMRRLEAEGFIRKIQGSGTYMEDHAENLLKKEFRRTIRFFSAPLAESDRESFVYELVEGVKRVAEERNVNLIHSPAESHDAVLDELEREKVSASPVIYLPYMIAPFSVGFLARLEKFAARPFILLDREISGVRLYNVTSDNRCGGIMAAAHLLRNGHRKVAILISEPKLQQIRQRIQGFCEIFALSGMEPEMIDCSRMPGGLCRTGIRNTLKDRLSRKHDFTAIFAVSDQGAFHAMEIMEQLHIRPGRDMSLMGFDGLKIGSGCNPPLATVVQSVETLCRTAVDLALHPSEIMETIHIPLSIREGGTVAAVGSNVIKLETSEALLQA